MLTEMVKGRTAAGRRGDAEGGAARGDRDPADARSGSSARCSASACSRSRCTRRRARRCPEEWGTSSGDDLDRLAWPRSTSARSTSCRPGSVQIVAAGPLLAIGVYNCDGELLRDRGPLLARRRAALRGRVRLRRAGRRLPAPRRALRHPDRPGADAAGLHPGRDVPGARARRRHGRRRRLSRSVATSAIPIGACRRPPGSVYTRAYRGKEVVRT